MNKAVAGFAFVSGLCLVVVVSLTSVVHDLRTKQLAAAMSHIAYVPSPVLVTVCGEYKGIVANLMFLNASNFIGRKSMERTQPTQEEWQHFYLLLDRITDLDGRFLDPYVFAEMMLAWQASMYYETELLLEKAMRSRPEDWRIPYYIGFNYFYFQKRYIEGSRFIMQAANISGSPSYFADLATRLAFYGERSKTALLFLEQMLLENKQVKLTPELKKRFKALESAAQIEDAALLYKERYRMAAKSVEELLDTGFLEEFPVEPYGGVWRLHANGRVDSSSRFIEKKK